MPDRIDLLINILLDDGARDDERDDAAMDLGQFNDERALNALMKVATDLELQNAFFIDVCGESIANILIKKEDENLFNSFAEQLTPLAKYAAQRFIKVAKPHWIRD